MAEWLRRVGAFFAMGVVSWLLCWNMVPGVEAAHVVSWSRKCMLFVLAVISILIRSFLGWIYTEGPIITGVWGACGLYAFTRSAVQRMQWLPKATHKEALWRFVLLLFLFVPALLTSYRQLTSRPISSNVLDEISAVVTMLSLYVGWIWARQRRFNAAGPSTTPVPTSLPPQMASHEPSLAWELLAETQALLAPTSPERMSEDRALLAAASPESMRSSSPSASHITGESQSQKVRRARRDSLKGQGAAGLIVDWAREEDVVAGWDEFQHQQSQQAGSSRQMPWTPESPAVDEANKLTHNVVASAPSSSGRMQPRWKITAMRKQSVTDSIEREETQRRAASRRRSMPALSPNLGAKASVPTTGSSSVVTKAGGPSSRDQVHSPRLMKGIFRLFGSASVIESIEKEVTFRLTESRRRSLKGGAAVLI